MNCRQDRWKKCRQQGVHSTWPGGTDLQTGSVEEVPAAGRPQHVVVVVRVCPLQTDAAALTQLPSDHVLPRPVLLTERPGAGRHTAVGQARHVICTRSEALFAERSEQD